MKTNPSGSRGVGSLQRRRGGTLRGQGITRGEVLSAREVMGRLPLVGGREEQEGMVVQEDATEGSSEQ